MAKRKTTTQLVKRPCAKTWNTEWPTFAPPSTTPSSPYRSAATPSPGPARVRWASGSRKSTPMPPSGCGVGGQTGDGKRDEIGGGAGQGPGAGREAAIRSLQAAGLDVNLIKDVTPIPTTVVVRQSGAASDPFSCVARFWFKSPVLRPYWIGRRWCPVGEIAPERTF